MLLVYKHVIVNLGREIRDDHVSAYYVMPSSLIHNRWGPASTVNRSYSLVPFSRWSLYHDHKAPLTLWLTSDSRLPKQLLLLKHLDKSSVGKDLVFEISCSLDQCVLTLFFSLMPSRFSFHRTLELKDNIRLLIYGPRFIREKSNLQRWKSLCRITEVISWRAKAGLATTKRV